MKAEIVQKYIHLNWFPKKLNEAQKEQLNSKLCLLEGRSA